ncbi:uncharacterized protein PG986_005443 [Apiospora aurea]|uniref:Uncharacterized protein n=1 Tax=Apiospora aurea TaxID=335848 RepID=A0ABR1QHK0_9PEZI
MDPSNKHSASVPNAATSHASTDGYRSRRRDFRLTGQLEHEHSLPHWQVPELAQEQEPEEVQEQPMLNMLPTIAAAAAAATSLRP